MLRRILIAAGYAVLTALVVVVTVLLVAYGQGYVYDFKTGRLLQTGLVIIQSTPGGADVSLNGKPLNKKTEYRKLYEAGSYTFKLTKAGYQAWEKTLKVVQSEVSMVQYAILLPTKPQVTTLDTQDAVLAQSMSKDHRHLAYVVGGAKAGLYTLDPGGSKPTRVFTAPEATKDKPAEILVSAQWSDDASHLLVVTSSATGQIYRVMNSSGGEQQNLTDEYRFDFGGLTFSYNNWKRLYWLASGELRLLDLDAKAVSGVLADKVTQFQMADDRLLYVRSDENGKSLWSLDSGGHKQSMVAALPPSESGYTFDSSSWNGQQYLAVVALSSRSGIVYSGTFGTTPDSKTVAAEADRVTFSPDGHLAAFYSSGAVTMYDLERSEIEKTTTIYKFDSVKDLKQLTWFDNFHLLTTQNGRVVWCEFDGANAHDLGAAYDGFPAYSTADMRSAVVFGDFGSGQVRLSKTLLKPLTF
jgi:hypothetical protein